MIFIQEDALGKKRSAGRQFGVLIKRVVNVISLIGRNGNILLGFIETGCQVDFRRCRQQIPPLGLERRVTRVFVCELHQFAGFGHIPRLIGTLQDPDMVHIGFRPRGSIRINLFIQSRGSFLVAG